MAIALEVDQNELVARGIRALVDELGYLEAIDFLNAINPPIPGADSVKLRREWLNSADEHTLALEVLEKVRHEIDEGKRVAIP